jgi:hypothetical protein
MAKEDEKDKNLGEGGAGPSEGGNTGGDEGSNTGAGEGNGNKGGKKDKEKKTVEVEKDVLERLLSTVEKQGEKLKDLEAAADIGRLSRIQQARNSGKLVKAAKVSVYEGKVVLGWARVKDDVFFDEQGRLHEDQQVELYLDNGKEKPEKTAPMSYRQFARITTKIEGEVIKESKDKEGEMSYTIQLEDGREFTLPIVFLN